MSQTEYVLTSSDEAQTLAEQGRRLALTMADRAIANALRALLWYLWDAEREGSLYEEERQSTVAIVDALLSDARRHLQTACQSDRFERDRFTYVNNIFGAAYQNHAPFGSNKWNAFVRAAIDSYKACQNGDSLGALTRFYEATDPALPEEYAKELLAI